MADKRRGRKPTDVNVLSVSLFLLEHSTGNICFNDDEKQELTENGYGSPPESKAF